MSKTYEFLKECGVFFLTTVNEDAPATRPFGAVMELEGALFVSTSNTKDVYFQMKKNPNIQIAALKNGTRDWIRVNAKAEEVFEERYKLAMLDACPPLKNMVQGANWDAFALFKISDKKSFLSINDIVGEVD
ncbi:MAG: NimC/NimA family protein [Clostridia bacterium]|nr:NimC/NimA family protein [Clostridia bacterium]